MAATICELKWLSYVLADFGISVSLPISMFCDNQAALHIMANPVFKKRRKHIELDCHVVMHIRMVLWLRSIVQVGTGDSAPQSHLWGGGALQHLGGGGAAAIVAEMKLEDEDDDFLDTG
ncbi:hypothetical protein Sango_2484700 [Sesamum angolense]|uniref:Uncharacterized protein n=1 Tax=Sesamum angolense TaxID=2727404 RepID=A0AAE1W3M9_9LAMI|nr:hypothetical protein Sango_2484700 [Sesamum angolense]